MTDTAIREQDMPEIVAEEYTHFRSCGLSHHTTLHHLARAYGLSIKTIERHRCHGLAQQLEERNDMAGLSATAIADLQQVARGEWKYMRKARREELVHLGLVRLEGEDPALTDHGKQTLKETA